MSTLSANPLQKEDIPHIINYWLSAEPAYLEGMGVDLAKMLPRENWEKMLSEQLSLSIPEKQSYAIVWRLDGEPVGHSNINKINMGKDAYMHLHLWKPDVRKKGIGTAFVKMTLPHYFETYALQTLYCEPYALNPAPNKTLEKVGFTFVKQHVTIPGTLNFEQPVNLWSLTRAQYLEIR